MTYDGYRKYTEWRARLLMTGRYDDLARHYTIPVDVDLAGQKLVIASRDDLALQLHRLRLSLNERGIFQLDPQIIAVELPGPTQRVWVTWHALDAGGQVLETAETIYVMDRADGGIRVAALHNTSLLVPEFGQATYRNRLARSRG